MGSRLLIALIVTGLAGFLTVQVWSMLREADETKVALITEAESYATRSRLVRGIDEVLDGLREIHAYWTEHSGVPVDEWAAYRGPEPERFGGLVRLLWVDEAQGTRFLSTPRQPLLDVPPSHEQWQALDRMRAEAVRVDGEAMLGPYATGDGHRIHVVINRSPVGALMVAELDARALLAELLLDQSQGYSVQVRWRDATLFERGTAAVDIPPQWVRDGMIRTSMGAVFRVAHAPTRELAAALVTPALAAVMPLGLAVSGLLGLLIYENGRVTVRANAARRAGQTIAELNRDLERQVAERTQELASRNADLVTITESVMHDLRGPLNALSVNLELLQHTAAAADSDSRDAIRRATSAVRGMAAILDRVVGLSMAAHSTFQRQPLAMESIVAEVFDSLQSVEQEPPVSLQLDALPQVEGDETLVRILVLNLLGNAMRHTRGKSPRCISVSASAGPEEVVFCVRDNGSGLDEEEARRLFSPRDPADGDARPRPRGLGLFIADRIVKRHGGRIWAEGIKGEQAAFHFTLAPGNA